MDNPIFKEVQKNKEKWLWALIISSTAVPVAFAVTGVVVQVGYGIRYGDNPMSNAGLIIILLLSLFFSAALIGLFAMARLETVIYADRICFRYFPFQKKYKEMKTADIEKFEVRKYSPIGEFGGWGIRFAGKKSGTAYNISGDRGLFLVMKNGKKIMIGTQMPDEMQRAINKVVNTNNYME